MSAAAALAGASAAYWAARRLPDGVRARWERTNHAGMPVTLLEGPAYVAGAALGAAVGSRTAASNRSAGSPAGLVAVIGAGGFGALDDLAGDGGSKGLGGHLRAAARGELTTGAIKIGGLIATGLVAAALADRSRGQLGMATLVGGGVVAGAANLANLFDLRPGRALKVTVLTGVPLALGDHQGAPNAAAAIGSALALLPADLRGESMLGDTGANAAGALVGLALVERCGPRGRLVALVGLTALTLASEKVSFTRVIEATPVLREFDAWGRPPR